MTSLGVSLSVLGRLSRVSGMSLFMSVGGTTAIGTISLGWVRYAFICAFVRGGALIVGVASVANIRVLVIGGKSISDKREIGTLHINSNVLAIILSKRAKESPSIRLAANIISYISFAFGMAFRRLAGMTGPFFPKAGCEGQPAWR